MQEIDFNWIILLGRGKLYKNNQKIVFLDVKKPKTPNRKTNMEDGRWKVAVKKWNFHLKITSKRHKSIKLAYFQWWFTYLWNFYYNLLAILPEFRSQWPFQGRLFLNFHTKNHKKSENSWLCRVFLLIKFTQMTYSNFCTI